MRSPDESNPNLEDAETVSADALRSWLASVPAAVPPVPVARLDPAEHRKHIKLRVRSVLALSLVVFYVALTLTITVSIIAGWVAYEEVRDFAILIYGGLIGLLGTAIALVGRKAGE